MPDGADGADQHAAHRADDARRLDLTPERLPPALELDVPGGEPAHDHRDRLQAGVARDGLDDRHERRQQDHPAQRFIVVVDHDAGAQLDEQRGENPGQAHERDATGRAPVQLGGVGAGQAEDVLRGLVAHDVEDVLHADGAEQAVGPVHDGDRHQVVLGDDARDLFLVGLRRHGHHVGVGDDAHRAGRVGREQAAQRDHADQVAMGVDHEHLEAAALGRHLADVRHGLRHRGRVVHGHDVGRHEAARRLVRVVEELLDLLRLLGLHQVEDRLGLLAGQLLHDVGRPVGRHRVEDLRDLLLLEGLHEVEQRLVVELRQDLARLLARQQPEQRNPTLLRRLGQQPRDVRRVRLGQPRGERVVAPLVEQLAQRIDELRAVIHEGHYGPTVTQSENRARPTPASATIVIDFMTALCVATRRHWSAAAFERRGRRSRTSVSGRSVRPALRTP